jgi:hypothetical protein
MEAKSMILFQMRRKFKFLAVFICFPFLYFGFLFFDLFSQYCFYSFPPPFRDASDRNLRWGHKKAKGDEAKQKDETILAELEELKEDIELLNDELKEDVDFLKEETDHFDERKLQSIIEVSDVSLTISLLLLTSYH